MSVSIVEIIKSFQLGLSLPPSTEELPPYSTERSATALTEHFLMTRLHQLRSQAVRKLSREGENDTLSEKVRAIVTKDPSERTPDEVSFLSNTYEMVKDDINDFTLLFFEMYYGTKAVFDAEDADADIREDLQGKFRPDSLDRECVFCGLSDFLRYYSGLQGKTAHDRAFVEKIDYYSDLISKMRTTLRDVFGKSDLSYTTRYSRDSSRTEERRIIKEYVDRYLPGPILCTMY